MATLDGVKGTWLAPAEATRIFFVLSTCLPAYRKINTQYEKIELITDHLTLTSSIALGVSKSLADDTTNVSRVWKAAYQEEHKLRMEEGQSTVAPVMLVVLGLVIGGGLVAAGVALAKGVP